MTNVISIKSKRGVFSLYLGRYLTMLATQHIQVLAEMRMLQGLQHLRLAQDGNRVGRQRQPVAATHVARMRFGKERERCNVRSN